MSRKLVTCLSLLIALGVMASVLMQLGNAAAALDGLNWATSQAPGGTTPAPAPTPRSVVDNVPVISQGDPGAGWDSRAQFDRWWDSACAPAALTMDLRAWGAPARIGQVLDRLMALHAITIQQGLLHAEALASVARGYGFGASTFWRWTLGDIAHVTSQGVPVLIDVVDAKRQTPYPALSVGHWLVVTSVSATQVEVRDSSAYHIRSLSLALFHTLFTGTVVVVWQGSAIALP
jgi:hypothetical protein